MGSMKSTTAKGNRIAAQEGKVWADFESLVRAGRTEYKNTMVEAASAEVYALRHVAEELFNLVREQGKTIANQQMQINELRSMIVKNRVVVDPEYTIDTVHNEYDEWVGLRKHYCKGINIMWNCGIPPVTIAFNEFNIYRYEKEIYGMIMQQDVKIHWSTLYNQCKKLTGMTLSRLLREYARTRKLNY